MVKIIGGMVSTPMMTTNAANKGITTIRGGLLATTNKSMGQLQGNKDALFAALISQLQGQMMQLSFVVGDIKQSLLAEVKNSILYNVQLVKQTERTLRGEIGRLLTNQQAQISSIRKEVDSDINRIMVLIKRMDAENTKRMGALIEGNSKQMGELLGGTILEGDNLEKLLRKDNEDKQKWLGELFETVFGTNFDDLQFQLGYGSQEIIDYVSLRIASIFDLRRKLRKGEIEDLDSLFKELTDSSITDSAVKAIMNFLNFVPFWWALLRALFFPEQVQLGRISNKNASPLLLELEHLTMGKNRERISQDDFIETLRLTGYSEKDAETLYNLVENIPSEEQLFELLRRERITPLTFETGLKNLGYNDTWIEILSNLQYFIPTPNDVIRFSVRDVFDEELSQLSGVFEGWDNEDYLKYTRQSGIKDEDARLYWGAHWLLPSINQGYEMLFRNEISLNELEALFRAADIAPKWREKLLAIAYKLPTRVDTRRMFMDGVIDENEVLTILKGQGYNERYAGMMQRWYIALKNNSGQQNHEIRELTRANIVSLYQVELINQSEAINRLVDLGYNQRDSQLLLQLADSQQSLDNEVDFLSSQKKRLRRYVEQAYINRTISKQEAKEHLQNSGLTSVQSDTMLDFLDIESDLKRKEAIVESVTKLYIGYEIDDIKLREILQNYRFTSREIEAQIEDLQPFRKLRYKDLTEAQITGAINENIITLSEGINQLRGNGYSDSDIAILGQVRGWLTQEMLLGTDLDI